MTIDLCRRKVVATLAGAAAWPLTALGQLADHVRRVGVLNSLSENDLLAQLQNRSFREALRELGWAEGQNIKIDLRWPIGDLMKD
jgi:putative tryptophan/tyrosine transport system substrate-binding protein